jgi:hypothetical protein
MCLQPSIHSVLREYTETTQRENIKEVTQVRRRKKNSEEKDTKKTVITETLEYIHIRNINL